MKSKHKKFPKKKGKSSSKVTKKADKSSIAFVAVGVILFIVLLSGIAMIYVRTNDITQTDNPFLKPFVKVTGESEDKEIAALVNGKAITMEEFNTKFARLPLEIKSSVTREDFLGQLIDEELLVQKAKQRGYEVTEAEVSASIESLALQAGVAVEDLDTILAQQNISVAELEEFFEKELLITRLINDTVINSVEVTDDDLEEYYQDNQELFYSPDAIKVSHIIFCHEDSVRCESNRTKEEAEAEAQRVLEMVDEDNFAELAMNYSEEPSAQFTGGALEGTMMQGYVTEQDPFDQDFLEAAFDLEEGEVSEPVETVFGFHIIKVFEKVEGTRVDLDDVREQLEANLRIEKQRERFAEYISELRNESTINRMI